LEHSDAATWAKNKRVACPFFDLSSVRELQAAPNRGAKNTAQESVDNESQYGG